MTVIAASGMSPASGDGSLKQIVQIPAEGFPKAEFRVYHGGEGVLTLKRLIIERLTREYSER